MSGMFTRRDVLAGTAGVGLAGLAGCGALGGGGGSVAVSSKRFTEQKILGYMTYEALKANTDLEVKDETGLGGSVQNFRAVKEGEVDVYWEYTGTAWATLPPKHSEVISDPAEIHSKVKSEFAEEHNLEVLDRAPFNNTYVLCANPDWASETGISTLSGFAEHVNNGNTDLTVVMNAEFQSRSDGWPGLAKHYGFDSVKSDLNVKNVGSGLTYQVTGEGEADVGMGFNTNPKILKFDLQTLEDDQGFFPVYNPAPFVNGDTLSNNSSMKSALNAIGPALTTDKIRNLNRRVSIDGEDAQTVAKSFLSDEGLI